MDVVFARRCVVEHDLEGHACCVRLRTRWGRSSAIWAYAPSWAMRWVISQRAIYSVRLRIRRAETRAAQRVRACSR